MKRTLLAVVPLVCISASAVAQPEQHNFDGAYAGVKAGISSTFANVDSTTNAGFLTSLISYPFFDVLKTEQRGILGHVFSAGAINIGYGKQLPNSQTYLGAELTGSASSKELSIVNNANLASNVYIYNIGNAALTTQTRAKLNTLELDLDFKPGYVVSPGTLLYGRLGLAFNRIQTTSNNNLLISNTTAFTMVALPPARSSSVALNYSKQKDVTGLRLGAGGEHYISNNLTLTADYVFTWYGNGPGMNSNVSVANNVVSNLPGIQTTNTLSNNTSTSMYAQTLMLGVNYYFNKAK